MDLAYLARNAVSAERARSRILRSGFTISGHKLWTDKEDLVCRIFYPDYFALCQVLDTRTKKAIQTRCQKLGLVPRKQSWEWPARQKLRKLYPEASREEICRFFPWRRMAENSVCGPLLRISSQEKTLQNHGYSGTRSISGPLLRYTLDYAGCRRGGRNRALLSDTRLPQQVPQLQSH